MKLITEGEKSCLQLEGKLTVIKAADLKEGLMTSLQKSNRIEIDLDEVTGIDLSCLQLFCSAHRTAIRDGIVLKIKNPHNPVFKQAGEHAGFAYYMKCRFFQNVECLWTGGAENDKTSHDG